jgi:hypothetical protein
VCAAPTPRRRTKARTVAAAKIINKIFATPSAIQESTHMQRAVVSTF